MQPAEQHDAGKQPEERPGWATARQYADVLMQRMDAILTGQVTAGGPEFRRLAASFREFRDELAGLDWEEAARDLGEQRAEQRGFERGRASVSRLPHQRHAAPARRPAWLRAVPGGKAVLSAGVLGVVVQLARRCWGAHAPAAAKAALARSIAHPVLAMAGAGTAAAVLVTGAVVVQQAPCVPKSGTTAAAAGNPGASDWGTRVTGPSSSPRFLVAVTRGKTDARSARPIPSGPPALVLAPSPSASPSALPSPSASPAPSGPAALSAPPAALDLTNGPATFTLTATGTGWVAWSITTAGSDLDFSATHGVLQAGQTATITVSADPAQALDGDTNAVFDVNNIPVPVILPPLPAVAAVPSPSPS
jgi:hypothetical protein